MRLLVLLIPVALVGGFLALDARHDSPTPVVASEARAVVPVPTPSGFGHRNTPATQRPLQTGSNATVSIDLTGLNETITASVGAALAATAAGLETAQFSIELTDELLKAMTDVLGQVALSVDGELEILTQDGDHIWLRGDGQGKVTVSRSRR